MKNFEGYLKRKLGNSYVLLAGGGEKLLSDFFYHKGFLYQNNNWDADTLGIGSWSFKASGYGNVGSGAAHAHCLSENSIIEVFRNILLSATAWSDQLSYRVSWDRESNSNRPNGWGPWLTIARTSDIPTKSSWNYDDVYSKLGHTHAYTDITGSGNTADMALVSTTTANTLQFKLLGSHAFDSTAYLPTAGGTMIGEETISNTSALRFNLRSSNGTRATVYTSGISGGIIHGGEDNASYLGANVQIGTWFGFGIYNANTGDKLGKNTFWHNARSGNTYTWGTYYKFAKVNGTDTYTEVSYNGHKHDSDYVQSVSISGNNLRVTKNGSNSDLTIPYATSASSASSASNANTVGNVANGDLTAKYIRALLLTSSDNLNNINDGFYTYANANNPANAVGNNGALIQISGENTGRPWDRFQLIFPGNDDGRIYYRHSVYSTDSTWLWREWKTIAWLSNVSYNHLTSWHYNVAHDSNYVTFDNYNSGGAPSTAWYNGFVTTHSNYLSSYIINEHRTSNWYVGYSENTTAPTWYTLIHSGNYTSYTVTKTGSGASGTWGINITGSAGAVAWNNVSSKPDTATRWPSWGEVTSKPDIWNILTITKNLTPTTSWQDTGIQSNSLTDGVGTYIILVTYPDTTNGWLPAHSGIFYNYLGTNGSAAEEIILYRQAHSGTSKRIFLRWIQTPNNQGYTKLLIRADGNFTTTYTYTFKFRRVI